MRRAVVGLVIAGVALVAAPAGADSWVPTLDRVTAVGGEVELRGELHTSIDGSTFDAVTQRDRYPQLAGQPSPRVGGLFDPEAGGLRVIRQDTQAHVYRLAPSGAAGPGCAEAGVPTPCLVPRLAALAHERLVTAAELGASLGGSVAAEVMPAPLVSTEEGRAMGWAAGLAALLAGLSLVHLLGRRRRATTIGQVQAAAAEARRAVKGSPLVRMGDQIEALVVRAEQLESARRACARRLAGLDPAALEARRATWARSTAPDAPAALAALAAEASEADQLAVDLSSSVAGMERIASALRALTLRTRGERGTRAVAPGGDPVEALLGELDLREAAQREADGALVPLPPSRA